MKSVSKVGAAIVPAVVPVEPAAPPAKIAAQGPLDAVQANVASAYVKPVAAAPAPPRAEVLETAVKSIIASLMDLDVEPAIALLAKTGVALDAHLGEPAPTGANATEQRLEWMLGQLGHLANDHALNNGISYNWLWAIDDAASKLGSAPFGTALVASFAARDAQIEAQDKAFRKEQKSEGRAVSGSPDWQKLVGHFHGAKMNGTAGAFLVQDWATGKSQIHEGVVRPVEGIGDAPFRLETKNGVLELNLNNVAAYALDCPQIAKRDEFHALVKNGPWISSAKPEYAELTGASWFDSHKLAGREALFLAFDSIKKEYAIHRGVIQPDPDTNGNAPFLLHTANGKVNLNINDMDETWVLDKSPLPLSKIAAKAKKEGFERSSGSFDASALAGRPAWMVNVKDGAYQLTEGVVRIDPSAMGNAQFLFETAAGTSPANINYVKELWVKKD